MESGQPRTGIGLALATAKAGRGACACAPCNLIVQDLHVFACFVLLESVRCVLCVYVSVRSELLGWLVVVHDE